LFLKLKSQLSTERQRVLQSDKEKQDVQQLLQEEINHRNNSDSKLKQYEVRILLFSFFKLNYFVLERY
jgi:demethoxyubiquinone hydroxylase (CLK1/Coq7/Cat5 family)